MFYGIKATFAPGISSDTVFDTLDCPTQPFARPPERPLSPRCPRGNASSPAGDLTDGDFAERESHVRSRALA